MAWQRMLLFTADNNTGHGRFCLFSWHGVKANKREEDSPWTLEKRYIIYWTVVEY